MKKFLIDKDIVTYYLLEYQIKKYIPANDVINELYYSGEHEEESPLSLLTGARNLTPVSKNGTKMRRDVGKKIAPLLDKAVKDSPRWKEKQEKGVEFAPDSVEDVVDSYLWAFNPPPQDSSYVGVPSAECSTNVGFINSCLRVFKTAFLKLDKQTAYRLEDNFSLMTKLSYWELMTLYLLTYIYRPKYLSQLCMKKKTALSNKSGNTNKENAKSISTHMKQWDNFLHKEYDCGGAYTAEKRWEQIQLKIDGHGKVSGTPPVETMTALFFSSIYLMFGFSDDVFWLMYYYRITKGELMLDTITDLLRLRRNKDIAYSKDEKKARWAERVNYYFSDKKSQRC